MDIYFLIRGALGCSGEGAKRVFGCVLKQVPKGLMVGDSSHLGERVVKDSRKSGVPGDHLEFCAS